MSAVAGEVVVVGGGPAGLTAAIRLATLGHRVMLIERHPWARPHPGESLTAGVSQVLATLGIRDSVLDGQDARAFTAQVCWDDPHPTQHPGPRWVLTDRARFARDLLAAARAAGIQVLQPATAVAAMPGADGWHLRVLREAAETVVTAQVLVDATGRSGLLRGRRTATAARTVALHAEVPDIVLESPCVEALPEGWLWAAPTRPERVSVMLFIDDAVLHGRGRAQLEDVFRHALRESRFLAVGAGVPLATPVRGWDATPYRVEYERPFHARALLVGDASVAIDPLSSSGVERAMRAGLTAAAVVHTVLRRPHDTALAGEFFDAGEREASRQHAEWAAEAYAAPRRFADRPFWRIRARPAAGTHQPMRVSIDAWLGKRVVIARDAQVIRTPVLVGEFVEPGRAVVHPALRRPIAFIDDVAIVPLLALADGRRTLAEILGCWEQRLPVTRAMKLAERLFGLGLLSTISADMATSAEPERHSWPGTSAALVPVEVRRD